jgi:hypothetical protein
MPPRRVSLYTCKVSSKLRRVYRLIWLLIGGGGLLFVACALLLVVTHPQTPANELVNRYTAWIFLPPLLMGVVGVYVSLRFWRCPHCGAPLRTRFPIPQYCLRCGHDVGVFR